MDTAKRSRCVISKFNSNNRCVQALIAPFSSEGFGHQPESGFTFDVGDFSIYGGPHPTGIFGYQTVCGFALGPQSQIRLTLGWWSSGREQQFSAREVDRSTIRSFQGASGSDNAACKMISCQRWFASFAWVREDNGVTGVRKLVSDLKMV